MEHMTDTRARDAVEQAVWEAAVNGSSMGVLTAATRRKVDAAIEAIEAEARATLLAELRREVRGLPTGIPRITDDRGDLQEAWQQGWESGRAAVLDLIRKAGTP